MLFVDVIDLKITKLALDDSAGNVTVDVSSLTNVTYATLTLDTPLPYLVRVPVTSDLRYVSTFSLLCIITIKFVNQLL